MAPSFCGFYWLLKEMDIHCKKINLTKKYSKQDKRQKVVRVLHVTKKTCKDLSKMDIWKEN